MKAQIKRNYAEAKKGQVFEVVEIKGKRVTVNINGRNVDFGFSEVQIVAPTTSDLLSQDFHSVDKAISQHMTNFEEFKNREFLGDKLLDLIISDILLGQGKRRNEVNRILPTYTNTAFLCKVFDKLNLQEHIFDKSDRGSKRKANAVEEYLFVEFTKSGYEHAKALISFLIPSD